MRLKKFSLKEQRELAELFKKNVRFIDICRITGRDHKVVKSNAKRLGYEYINRNWERINECTTGKIPSRKKRR